VRAASIRCEQACAEIEAASLEIERLLGDLAESGETQVSPDCD
jgi:hypothetical protein